MEKTITPSRFHYNPATLLHLLKMSLPMVVSQGAFAAMIFTDRLFLSQISPVHMAAALGGGVAWFFTISLFNGVLAYANALVAQYLGAGMLDKCARVVTQGFLLTLLCLPPMGLMAWGTLQLFSLMGHDPAQVALEEGYFLLLILGSIFTLWKVCLASFFSGIGKTKVVMICDVIGIAVNIPLTYMLIFGKLGLPALGIDGAAIGTVISTVLTLLLFIGFYVQKPRWRDFRIGASLVVDMAILTRYVRLGLPSGIEMFLAVAAFNLFLLMFQSYGIPEAASAAIVFNWDILSFVPMMGLSIAVMSLIGRYVGAGDLSMAREVITAGYILGVGYSALLALLFVLFRYQLVEIFIVTPDHAAEIRALAGWMMIGLATYVLSEGVILVADGALRGAGDTRWILLTSTGLHWGMLAIQYVIIKVLGIGPHAAWLSFVVLILAIAVVFARRLAGDRWRDPAQLQRVMADLH